MVKILRGLAVVLLSLQVFLPLGARAEDGSPANQVIISEFQTGSIDAGAENPKGEFVELYNNGSAAIDATGWKVEYLTKTHDGISEATRILATLSGNIDPQTHLLISYQDYLEDADLYFSGGPSTGYLAKGDGSIRLVDDLGAVIDLVGYGAPNNFETNAVSAPNAGYSLQRCSTGGEITDANNNQTDFAIYESITPGGGIDCPVSEPAAAGPSCEGIVLSEILPNPSSSDTGHEFIELYNPTTDFINLNNCGLQIGTGTPYVFGNLNLAPEEYRAFSDSTTGITLPNSAGGTVYLLSADNTELQAISYAAGLPDDVSWAWFGGDEWAQTYTPTPNGINVNQPTKACAYGQIRNPETGRCVSLGLGGSQPGASSALKPCKPGQERNPATNRCRSTVSAAAALKPCSANQTRNPETNRCRKDSSAAVGSSSQGVKDIASASAGKHSLWFGGAVFAAAGGYGVWEWRRELLGLFKRFTKTPKA